MSTNVNKVIEIINREALKKNTNHRTMKSSMTAQTAADDISKAKAAEQEALNMDKQYQNL